MEHLVERLPFLTTAIAIAMVVEMFRHYRTRRSQYLKWWIIGVITYGFGTLTESIHVVLGWHIVNLKVWYVAGALLGGFPLAQGSVYLLMSKPIGDWSARICIAFVLIATSFIVLTPISLDATFDGDLTGKVFTWQWVRLFSPFINIYAVIFLVGGAIYSAGRYFRAGSKEAPFKGNILIAIGGILPGIGGSMARAGDTEILYVTELFGLILIYCGYKLIKEYNIRVLLKSTT